jgi:FkbM family methyltransferase
MRTDQVELLEINRHLALFELLIRRLYQMRCGPGDICVDAGANQGDHAVPMATAVGPTGLVHAFEPLPRFAQRLRFLAKTRHLQIRVHKIALSDHVGTAQFRHVKNVPGWSGLYERTHTSSVDIEMIDVEVSTLDKLLWHELTKLRFYKLDCECGELSAMRGSKQILTAMRPLIAFENGFTSSAKIAGYTKHEWFAFFASIDYRVFDLYGYEITPERWPDRGQPFNSIAAPRGSVDEKFVETAWRTAVDETISEVKNGTLRYEPQS